MILVSILHHYLFWHYTQAFKQIFHVWLNLLWFTINFFSIPQLTLSLFSPWKRMVEGRGRKFNLEDFAGYIIIGFLSRVIGFVMRSIVIAAGLFFLFLVIIMGFTTYIFWIVAPVVIIGMLALGITYIIT